MKGTESRDTIPGRKDYEGRREEKREVIGKEGGWREQGGTERLPGRKEGKGAGWVQRKGRARG